MKLSTTHALCSVLLMTLAAIAPAGTLHAQPVPSPLARYRLHLERTSGSHYRPWFGSSDSGRSIDRTDTLLRWGFDDQEHIHGYDSTLIGFSGGELVALREGTSQIFVVYPFYPTTIDTVQITLRRDREGLAASLVYRPIPVVRESAIAKVRRQERRGFPHFPARYHFDIYAGFVGNERRFYFKTRPYDYYFRNEARRIADLLFHPLLASRQTYPYFSETEFVIPATASSPALSGYDSTIVRFVEREVVPLRMGTTRLVVHYPASVDTVRLQVDSAMVVRVLP